MKDADGKARRGRDGRPSRGDGLSRSDKLGRSGGASRSEGLSRRGFVGAAGIGAASLIVPWGAGAYSEPSASTARGQRTVTLERRPAAGAWIELDRSALAANLAEVRRAAGGRPVMGVVKANAYGHGLVPTALTLEAAGVDALMVVTVDEAVSLRDAGVRVPIMNFGPYDADAAETLVALDVDQVVYTAEAVRGMAAARRRLAALDGQARVQLMIDTGLGRVGVPYPDAGAVFRAIAEEPTLKLSGTLTALTEDLEFDREQLRRFLDVCEAARGQGIDPGLRHVASSAAVLDFPASHLDMVRPGIMLYGHYPNDRSRAERPVDLRPVLSLHARVALIKTMRPGDSVGYHRAWQVTETAKVATLPIGHSEGYPPAALEAGGHASIHGRACRLVGGVTSNHLEVLVPEDLEVEVGDVATLIAAPPPGTADASPRGELVAAWGELSVYGLVMRMNPLLPRGFTDVLGSSSRTP